jgi:hypothetical protein
MKRRPEADSQRKGKEGKKKKKKEYVTRKQSNG